MDKSTNEYFEVKPVNPDYSGQELIISPASLISGSGGEITSAPLTGVKVLRYRELAEANDAGELSGELKKTFEAMDSEDPFVLMIIRY